MANLNRLFHVLAGPETTDQSLIPYRFASPGEVREDGFWIDSPSATQIDIDGGFDHIAWREYTADEQTNSESPTQDLVPFGAPMGVGGWMGFAYRVPDGPRFGARRVTEPFYTGLFPTVPTGIFQIVVSRPASGGPFTIPASGTLSIEGFTQAQFSTGINVCDYEVLETNSAYYILTVDNWAAGDREDSRRGANWHLRSTGGFRLLFTPSSSTPSFSDYVNADAISYGPFGQGPTESLYQLPSRANEFPAEGAQLFMVDSRGTPVITWDITGAGSISSPRPGVLVDIDNGQPAQGATMPTAYLAFSFQRQALAIERSDLRRQRVWCSLTEVGLTAGLLQVGSEAEIEADDATELPANQLEANVTTRYHPNLAYATLVEDDLGRVWTVSGAAISDDRRMITYTCFRTTLFRG